MAPRARTVQHRRDLDQLAASVGGQVARAASGIDTGDIDGWWDRRRVAITDVVAGGYGRGAVAAERYLLADAADHGVALAAARPDMDRRRVEMSLRLTGPVRFKSAIAKGVDPAVAAQRMRKGLVATAQRHALAGSRETVSATVDQADGIIGHRRVTSPGACKFCEMLAGRGAVYKTSKAAGAVVGGRGGRPRGNQRIGRSFHDHCRCTVEPIYGPAAAGAAVAPTVERANRRAGARALRERAAALADRQLRASAEATRIAARASVRAGNARRRAAIERARAAALTEQRAQAVGSGQVSPAILEQYGITEAQFLNARANLDTIRRDIREMARREADQLAAWLDDRDLGQMTRPARRQQTTDVAGRRVTIQADSGYDWIEGLDEATARQVRRRFTDSNEFRPDVVADQVRRITNLDLSDDEAMDWLIDRWLTADGLRSIGSGRLPRYVDADSIIPSDYAAEGYRLARLFVDDADDAAAHIAQVQAEAAEGYAARVLGRPRNGPAPWEMDAADFVAELDEVESILAETLDHAGASYRWAEARLRELAPPDLDTAGITNSYELWHQIRLVAQSARLVE